MNERIEQLAAQACVVVRFNIHPHTYKQIDDPNGMHARLEFNKEKFAELIVRECIAMADEFEIEVNRSGLVDRMKEHFGVEE